MRIRLLIAIALLLFLPASPAWTADEGPKPQAGGPAPPAGNQPEGDGQDDGVSDLEREVRDPLVGSGTVSEGLADIFNEFNEDSDNHFDSAHDSIHKDRTTAENTDGYQKLRDLKRRVEERLEIIEAQFSDWLESLTSDNADIKKAVDEIKETEERPRHVQVGDILKGALDGNIGDATDGQKEQIRKMLRAGRWINWLRNTRDDLREAMELLEDTSAPYRRVSRLGGGPGASGEQVAYRIAVREENACVSKVLYVEQGSGGPGNIAMTPQDGSGGSIARDGSLSVEEQAFIDVIRQRGRPDIADKIARKFAAIDALNLPPDQESKEKLDDLAEVQRGLELDLKLATQLGTEEQADDVSRVNSMVGSLKNYVIDPTRILPLVVQKRMAEIEAERKKAEGAPDGDSSYDGDNISIALEDAGNGAISMDSGLSVEEEAFIDVIRRTRPDIADKIERKFSSIEATNLTPKGKSAQKNSYLHKLNAELLVELDTIVKYGGEEQAKAFVVVTSLLRIFALYVLAPTDPDATPPEDVNKRMAEIEAERKKAEDTPDGDSSYDGDNIAMAPEDAANGAVSMDGGLPVVEQAFIDVVRRTHPDIADMIENQFSSIDAAKLTTKETWREKQRYLVRLRRDLRHRLEPIRKYDGVEQAEAFLAMLSLLNRFAAYMINPADPFETLPPDVEKRAAEIEAERKKAEGAPDGDSSYDGENISMAPEDAANWAVSMDGGLSVEEEAFIGVIRDKRLGPHDDIADKIARKFAAIKALNLPPDQEKKEKLKYLAKRRLDLGQQYKAALQFGTKEQADAIYALGEQIGSFITFISNPAIPLPQDVAKRAAKIEAERMKAEGAPDGTSSDGGNISLAPQLTNTAAGGDGGTGEPADDDKDTPTINNPPHTDGDDHFEATKGPDEFTGGKGKDRYFFETEGFGRNTLDDGDRITDYESGEEIVLTGPQFTGEDVTVTYDAKKDETRLDIDLDKDGKPDRSLILNGDKRGDVGISRNCCGARMTTIQIDLSNRPAAAAESEERPGSATPKKPEKKEEDERPTAPSLDIAQNDGDQDPFKVTRQVLLLVKSGQTGEPVENFVWKELADDPDLPVADTGSAPADTAVPGSMPTDAYAVDVTGGWSGKDGGVLLASATPAVTKNGDGRRPALTKIANGLPPVTREVFLNRRPTERLVVGVPGQPATRADRPQSLPAVLDDLGFGIEVTTGYRIGNTSLLLVDVPADQVAAFIEKVSNAEGVMYVEPDPCFEKKRGSYR